MFFGGDRTDVWRPKRIIRTWLIFIFQQSISPVVIGAAIDAVQHQKFDLL